MIDVDVEVWDEVTKLLMKGTEPGRGLWFAHDVGWIDVLSPQLAAMTTVVAELVAHHLAPMMLHAQGSSDRSVRRPATKVSRIDLLVRVAEADAGGRPPKVLDGFPAGEWLLDRAANLSVTRGGPEPLLRGRDLIDELGLEPGPRVGAVLSEVFDAQVEGDVTSRAEAVARARALVT